MNVQTNFVHQMLPERREQLKLIEIFLYTVTHFFGGFDELFRRVTDPRDQRKIVYPLSSLAFIGIIMLFLCRLGSRRQINDKLRNNGPSEEKFFDLFQVATIPHGDTLNYLFKVAAGFYARAEKQDALQYTVNKRFSSRMSQNMLSDHARGDNNGYFFV